MRSLARLALGVLGAAAPAARSGAHPAPHATDVSGVVFDSLAMRGLAAATVQLAEVGTASRAFTTTTDSAGRFGFTGVPAGTYLLGFFHPKTDSLGIATPVLRVDVRTDDPIRAPLSIPSAATIVRAVCGAGAAADSVGLVLGSVRAADGGLPRAGARLTARWAELVVTRDGIRRDVPVAAAETGSGGMFAVCGVPASGTVLVQAASGSDSSGVFEIEVPANGLARRDVFVAPVRRVRTAVGDSVPDAGMLRGAGRLRGRVMAGNGQAIAGAHVMVWGTGLESRTDADGSFSLAELPGGTHTLEVRAVGFAPARRAVDITGRGGGSTAVELTTLAITLDTVRVVAQRVYSSPRIAEFEHRKHLGFGRFIDEAELEKRNAALLTDLLRTIPGVLVQPGTNFNDEVFMRGGLALLGSGYCRPDLILDGVRVTHDEFFPINSIVTPSQLRAIEVYTRGAMVPHEFSALSGCGAIVLWTGPRGRR